MGLLAVKAGNKYIYLHDSVKKEVAKERRQNFPLSPVVVSGVK